MNRLRQLLAVCLVALFFAAPSFCQGDAPQAAARPKLVVLLVVDQMRTDYIEQYGHQWKGGLKRLVEQGAWYREAAYPYFHTVTCTGHATISTGTFPSKHGMILNGWWDRETKSAVNCTDDPQAKTLSLTGDKDKEVEGRHSPKRLMVPTLAEEMRAQLGEGTRVVTMSIKARSAIMMAGHRADAVLWFDREWVTSSYYVPEPPTFLYDFFRGNRVDSDFRRTWSRARRDYLYDDFAKGEKPPGGWSSDFPHLIGGAKDRPDSLFYSLWAASPYSDAYLGKMAQYTVEKMKLGQMTGTDFLGVSFSALDSVGHNFGPHSHEVQDVLVRLDEVIGKFLDYLDKTVGPQNYVLALSSDHGVAPIPERMQKEKRDAGRVPTLEVAQNIENALFAVLGAGPHVARVVYTDVYLHPGTLEKLRQNPAAKRAVEESAKLVKGVAEVFFVDELQDGSDNGNPLKHSASLSHYPGRSGDVLVLPKPYWFLVNPSRESPPGAAATHGTGYDYDARVPVILMGPGIRGGKYAGAATPADIAPTLGQLVGVTLTHADGRVLSEALAPGAPAAAPAKPAKAP